MQTDCVNCCATAKCERATVGTPFGHGSWAFSKAELVFCFCLGTLALLRLWVFAMLVHEKLCINTPPLQAAADQKRVGITYPHPTCCLCGEGICFVL